MNCNIEFKIPENYDSFNKQRDKGFETGITDYNIKIKNIIEDSKFRFDFEDNFFKTKR